MNVWQFQLGREIQCHAPSNLQYFLKIPKFSGHALSQSLHSDLTPKKAGKSQPCPVSQQEAHTKYMGPDPHTKSMTHTNCVEFARFLQKCHTKCMGVTQNVLSPHKTHDIFYQRALYGRRPFMYRFLIAEFLMTEI